MGQHGVRWSGSAGATVAVGLLSVSTPAAFSNVGFALLRLKQHTCYNTPLPLCYDTHKIGGGYLFLGLRVSLACAMSLCAALPHKMRRCGMAGSSL
jgi:hypothetical protein